jgi:hypothetical protein
LNSNLVSVFVSALAATFNPSLLAAVTLMLLSARPRRLMLGYLLGAYTTSLGVGLAVIFSLHGSHLLSSSRHTLSPTADVVVGVIALAVAVALATDRDAPVRSWRARRRQRRATEGDRPSWRVRMLKEGSARVTFCVGVLVSFPGVTYLNALHHINAIDAPALVEVLLVGFFCVMQQLILELPLLSYLFAPDWTPRAVHGSREWLHRRGRLIAVVVIAVLGLLLILKGAVTLAG